MSLVSGDDASGAFGAPHIRIRWIGPSPCGHSGYPAFDDVIERRLCSTGTPAVTVTTIIGYAGDIVTEAYTWVTDTVSLIQSSPLILTFVLVAFVGLGVGLIRRMMRL